MFLSRIHLNCRCKEARRDLANPYQLHSTLCRAFSPPDRKCPDGDFLWRLEPETDKYGHHRILVQSRKVPDWSMINISNWLLKFDPPCDIIKKLKLESIEPGYEFRFRLRGNPCVTRNGKRLGLLKREDQERWIARKAKRHGFDLLKMTPFDLSDSSRERYYLRISHEQMLRGKRHDGREIRVFAVLYEGILKVIDPDIFRTTLLGSVSMQAENEVVTMGIGHGKVMGLGVLCVAPIASD